jgi:hypothetical protein
VRRSHRGGVRGRAAAIAEASKRIIPQYGMVNGSAVNLATKNTPTNFSDLANGFIRDWWKSNGAQEEKEGELFLGNAARVLL